MSDKLTPAEMQLFCLGAAMLNTHREGARIIANALDEMQRTKRAARKHAKRRPKK